MRPGRGGAESPCNCVFRAVFRACYARFRQCASKEKYISRVSLEANPGRKRNAVWGLKDEEYTADFCLVSRRVLSEYEHKVFKFHFLLGADWKLCCRKLSLDRGTFFHDVYRIEQRLGRTFYELEPYHLFPVDEYFASSARDRAAEGVLLAEPECPASAGRPLLKYPIARKRMKAMAA